MHRSRKNVCALIAALSILLIVCTAASAGATIYCVNDPACPAEGVSEGKGGEALQKALDAAETHPSSSVLIGPGTYSRSGGFSYVGGVVAIRGAGRGSTFLTDKSEGGGGGGAPVLKLDANAGPSPNVADLTIDVPDGKEQTGLMLEAGVAERVAIEGGGFTGPGLTTGLDLFSDGVFADGSVELVEAGTTQAVEAHGGEVSGSTLLGSYGIQGGPVTVRGSRISAASDAIDFYRTTDLVEDTLIDLRGGGGTGVRFGALGGSDATATLRNVTIVNGSLGSAGIRELAYKPESGSTKANLLVEDSIVAQVARPLVQSTTEAGASAAATIEYSSWDAAEDSIEEDTGGAPTVSISHPVSEAPDFVSPILGPGALTEGDWRLAPGSPLIDAGAPGPLTPAESGSDLGGGERLVHGRRDVGAYEYQWRPPSLTAVDAEEGVIDIGKPDRFSGRATTVEDGDGIASYQWTFDDDNDDGVPSASVPAGATVEHAFSTPGEHTATLTVRDLAGLTASTTVSVFAQPLSVCALAACSSCGPVRAECPIGRSLIDLKIVPGAFRAAPHGAMTAARGGAKVTYQVLGGVSLAEFKLERIATGVQHGGTCVRPRKHLHGTKCTRRTTVATFSRISPQGGSGFRLTGRAKGHALAPGRYLLLAHLASTPHVIASAPFLILR